MQIDIKNHSSEVVLTQEEIRELARRVLEQEGAPSETEVSISFADTDEIHALNKEYRNKDASTDVLSFPCDDPYDFDPATDEICMLGDIIICPEICTQQSETYGHTPAEEMKMLLVHGCLHLMGYDHIDDEDARIMQAKEKDILSCYGIETGYEAAYDEIDAS